MYGIIANNDIFYNHVVGVINDALRSKCEEEGFIYVDQSSIKIKCSDLSHLAESGSTKLLDNILNCFTENFNPYLWQVNDISKDLF